MFIHREKPILLKINRFFCNFVTYFCKNALKNGDNFETPLQNSGDNFEIPHLKNGDNFEICLNVFINKITF